MENLSLTCPIYMLAPDLDFSLSFVAYQCRNTLAKSREVFRYALRYNAAAVVLVHNHPSGNPEPSHEDIVVTQRIADAGQIMEIPVLDHIIIGDGTFVSLCERGYV